MFGAAGGDGVLAIAIFKKPGDAKLITLAGTSGSPLFTYSSGAGMEAQDEQVRKQFLSGCSYVLALPLSAGTSPRWLKITSSWTTPGPGATFVALDTASLGGVTAKFVDGNRLDVIVFENLIRVDQFPVTLH